MRTRVVTVKPQYAAFKADWNRRHRRPEDVFERAFGWFIWLQILTTKGE